MDYIEEQKKIISKINQSAYRNSIKVTIEEEEIYFHIILLTEDSISDVILFIKEELSTDIKTKIIHSAKVFEKELDLSNCIFEQKVNFLKCTFKKKVNFSYCIFEKKVTFNESNFEEKITFKDSVFKDKTRLQWSTFHKAVNFHNTTFKNLADFYCSTFQETQQFFLTDFLNVTIFSHVIFENQVQFLYNKTESNSIISFENATFKQALDISRANFWGKVNFWKANVIQPPNKTSLYETDPPGKEKEEKKVKKKIRGFSRLRETNRIIKNEFRKSNNHIESIHYHKKEMFFYRKELQSTLFSKELSFNTFLKNLGNLIVIWFNWLTNRFGTAPFISFAFTTLFIILSYSLFLYNQGFTIYAPSQVHEVPKDLIHFINLTRWDYKPFGVEIEGHGWTILFFSRLFIGLCIYQTAVAFRKYSKN